MEHDDLQLSIITEEMDVVLQTLCIKHKMSPLNVCAILLARMIHFTKMTDSQEDLGRLMFGIAEGINNKEFDNPGNLH